MKAEIYFSGDPSVGIFSFSYEVNGIEITNNDDREAIRIALKTCFETIESEICNVYFEDECSECYQLLPKDDVPFKGYGRCSNKKCISNQ